MKDFNLDQQIEHFQRQIAELTMQLHQAQGALAAFVALRDAGAVVSVPDAPVEQGASDAIRDE